MNYRVVSISNNLEDYPDCREDTKKFPELVDYVSDEMAIFVVQEDTQDFCRAEEFFFITDVKRFKITEK